MTHELDQICSLVFLFILSWSTLGSIPVWRRELLTGDKCYHWWFRSLVGSRRQTSDNFSNTFFLHPATSLNHFLGKQYFYKSPSFGLHVHVRMHVIMWLLQSTGGAVIVYKSVQAAGFFGLKEEMTSSAPPAFQSDFDCSRRQAAETL